MDKKTFETFDKNFPLKGFEVENQGEASEITEALNLLSDTSKELSSLNSVDVDQNYFTTILPKFYERQEKRRYQFSFGKLVYSASIAFTTSILLFISFNYVQTLPKTETLTQNNTATQLPSYTEDSYIASADQFSDSVVEDSNLQTEINNTIFQSISNNGSGSNYNLIKNDTDYDKVLTQLNDEELENIYSQLQDIKIL